MSGWVVAAVVAAVFGVLLIVVLVVVSRAVMRTAQNASDLLVALEEVRANTAMLAELDGRSEAMVKVAADAASAAEQLRNLPAGGNGHEPEGR